MNASRNLDEFRTYAEAVRRLQPYGDVQIDIGVLADKSWYEMPPTPSPWHEYCNEISCTAKFFPHPKIAPFLPADWVAKNRALLLAKAEILRKLGLHAAFSSDDTHFLPEAFFERYPYLRGPRVDHPRRSTRAEFAWCVDLEETRDMITWMTEELLRNVPEIRTIQCHTNDDGGGFCWAAALYSGPNGPHHCENRGAGVRVRDYAEAIHTGARKGGGDVTLRIDGPFWQGEDDLVAAMLPPNTYLNVGAHDPEIISAGTFLNQAYPLRGLVDPIGTLSTLEKLTAPGVRTIRISTSSYYDRMDDSLPAVEWLTGIVQASLHDPTSGFLPRFGKLHQLALSWGGERNAATLMEAFYEMHEAFLLKNAAAPRFSCMYCAVSTRFITRPLLFQPDVLSREEEASFLPYIFNISEKAARDDYADIHGEQMTGPAAWDDAGLQLALARALHAAQLLEGVTGTPNEPWLRQCALSLRMWTSEVRSINNFYFAQQIRTRHAATIAAGPQTPSTEATYTGDPDYLAWNQIQRDEFDNANELIALLQNGGLALMGHAQDKKYEDTFLLGPDILGALQEKTRLMRREWLEVQTYLTSPNK